MKNNKPCKKQEKAALKVKVGDFVVVKNAGRLNLPDMCFEGTVKEIADNGFGFQMAVETRQGVRWFDSMAQIILKLSSPDCSPENPIDHSIGKAEQKECECHCHHHGNCVEDAACIAMYCEHCLPQPTDGLKNWWEDFNKPEVLNGFAGWPLWMKDYIDNLLAEQKQKTREDTLNNIEAIWTRLMNETDDPAYKEVYTRCIKALKI